MYIFLTAVIVLIMIFIFDVNKKEFYKFIRTLEFIISLPGASIFSSLVDSFQIACNYKGYDFEIIIFVIFCTIFQTVSTQNFAELINYVDETTKKYGNITRFILGTDMFVVLAKPEDYKLVLGHVHGTNKSSPTKVWESIISDGIVRAAGASHRLRRKIIQPLLNIKCLSEYVTFFDNYSNFCADNLEENVDGPIFDFKPYIAPYAFNRFLATTVGIQGTARKGGNDELLYWQEEMFKEEQRKAISSWPRINWICSLTKHGKQMCIARKNLADFIYSILPQKAASRLALQNKNGYNATTVENTKPLVSNYWNRVEQLRNDVTSKSCEVSDENFLNDVKTVFFAIQNTITELVCFVILMLAMHTDVQEKLREEISDTFNNEKIDAQLLFNMRYFHMVFQETLRLFPIAPIIVRQLTGDIKLESCTLPDGCYVMIPVCAIHRNPAYWHKPLEFIPERFSSSNERYAYIPFSTGLRDCLGQRYAFLSVATIIVNMVRRFRFVSTGSVDNVRTTTDIVLRTRDAKISISHV